MHTSIRMQTTWLTLIALLTLGLVLAFSPSFDAINAYYARSFEHLKLLMDYPVQTDGFNAFRASLAADLLFLLAYGFLLRTSAKLNATLSGGALAAWAARLTFPLMAADLLENLTTLRLLTLLERGASSSRWQVVMNAATFTKWGLAGVVCGLLGVLWWQHRRALKGQPRLLATLGSASFLIGAAASFFVAALLFLPQLRDVQPTAQPIHLPLAVKLIQAAAVLAPGLALVIQIAALGLPGLLFRFLILGRVAFGVLLFLAAFGPIAFGPSRALLGGIVQVHGFALMFQVAMYSVLVALACGTQINLVRAYSARRLDDAGLRCLKHRTLRDLVFWTALLGGVFLPLCAFLATPGAVRPQEVLGVALGTGAALAATVAAELIAAYLGDPSRSRDLPQFVIPALGIRALTGVLLAARHATRSSGPRWSWIPVFLRFRGIRSLFRGVGYVERSPSGQTYLLPGHTLAILLASVTFVLYAITVYKKLADTSSDGGTSVPTLTAILLLALLVSWGLSALTFFLDRYRIPLLAGTLGLAMITGGWTSTDHIFKINDTAANEKANPPHYDEKTPADVLAAFANPIVVSAAGGGIQAGAWAAQVLHGLDTDSRLKDTLRDRVALVSSVSGGSMGALYFGAYQQLPAGGTKDVLYQSTLSSLDDVATALAGLDVWRVFGIDVWYVAGWLSGGHPRSRSSDRGFALEESWRERLPVGIQPTVSHWATLAGTTNAPSHRRFPAFLFNSTVVETGQPISFATTAMPSRTFATELSKQLTANPVVQSFNTLYGLYDAVGLSPRDVGLEATTAARLSAAFPYVSPAAAPDWNTPNDPAKAIPRPNYHLVDGGYYDNYGLFALTQWIDDALTDLDLNRRALPPSITVVVIRGEMDYPPASVPRWGWLEQVPAPATTVLGTRSYGQWAGGGGALKLLSEKWESRVKINAVSFAYPVEPLQQENHACADPPLSWILTDAQINCLQRGWQLSKAQLEQFNTFAVGEQEEGPGPGANSQASTP